MPQTSILVLSYIACLFGAFMLTLGGVELHLFLRDREEAKEKQRAAVAERPAEHKLAA